MRGVPTHCPYCALQCATSLHPVDRPGAVEVQPRAIQSYQGGPTNKGGLCRKGWTAPEVLTVPDRLTSARDEQFGFNSLHVSFTCCAWRRPLRWQCLLHCETV